MALYLLKISISLAVVYGFYRIFLRKLTFHHWNRWYLLGYTLLSFFIPFIDINPFLQEETQTTLVWVPTISGTSLDVLKASNTTFYWQQPTFWIISILCLGICFSTFRFVGRWISLMRIRKNAEKITYDGIDLYRVSDPIMPFSFGRSIYVNPTQHDPRALEEIMRHEFVHVRDYHTIDLIWTELLTILNWYNPFAWLLRHAIRQNLEFIADQHVLGQGVDKKQYQYLLLQVMGAPEFSMGVPFNLHSLKKRITMMNQMRSAKVHLLKFLFLLPLLAVMLLSFRTQQLKQIKADTLMKTMTYTIVVDTLPATNNKKVIVIKPQGADKVDVADEVVTVDLVGPTSEVITENIVGLPEVPKTPNAKGYIVSIANNAIEEIVIIKNAQGRIEKAIPLKDWKDNAAKYEKKYGALPKNKKVFVTVMGAPGIDEGMVLAKLNGQPMEGLAHLNEPHIETITIGESIPNNLNKKVVIRSQRSDSLRDAIILVDGEKIEGLDMLNKIDPNTIASMNVLKGEKALAFDAVGGKNGVILITTKKPGAAGTTIITTDSVKTVTGYKLQTKVVTDSIIVRSSGGPTNSASKQVIIKMDGANSGSKSFGGLYIVQGKEYTAQQFKELNIEPQKIESINVLKGESATAVYGEKGKDGVIVIKLKSEK